MTGAYLKNWVEQKNVRPEWLAVTLDVSVNTIYKWFRSPNLDRVTVLALHQIGCHDPEEAVVTNPDRAKIAY